MLIRFWGVRGSLPAPTPPSDIKAKIQAIIEKIAPEDLADAESRKHFLDGLPPWLYGTVGGNSPCVSVDIDGLNEPVIFDCGSGLRELGIACVAARPRPSRYHVFMSHFHWDHMLGFPFFGPAYNPSVTMDLYSPQDGLRDYFAGMMKEPYCPVCLENMASTKNFHLLEHPLAVGTASIAFKKMNHPGGSCSYLVSQNGKRFVYATDVALSVNDFIPNEENSGFFKNADLVVIDAQYTLEEALEKYDWGHNSFSMAVDFAASWGIKRLVLFHHDPAYDDRKLHEILQTARRYAERMDIKGVEVSLAVEGLEISL
ncbi:MAG: MBL fold metallo-hydrolase [Treponema sp.]|nr:MBL fold metallo-hydrolase [Treponema sp.]